MADGNGGYMIDKNKIEEAVKLLLEGIGENVNREGLIETPNRVARMYEEIFGGLECDAKDYLIKTFESDMNDMVIEKDISFYSMCEHHLMPFFGVVHIAYIPNGKVVGLSKLARTVEVFARRPQIQENMTVQIAEAVMDNLHAKGVMVMIEAEHLCMSMRGIKKPGSKTVTCSALGVFEDNKDLRREFMDLVKR